MTMPKQGLGELAVVKRISFMSVLLSLVWTGSVLDFDLFRLSHLVDGIESRCLHGIPAPGTATSTTWKLALGFRWISAGS